MTLQLEPVQTTGIACLKPSKQRASVPVTGVAAASSVVSVRERKKGQFSLVNSLVQKLQTRTPLWRVVKNRPKAFGPNRWWKKWKLNMNVNKSMVSRRSKKTKERQLQNMETILHGVYTLERDTYPGTRIDRDEFWRRLML